MSKKLFDRMMLRAEPEIEPEVEPIPDPRTPAANRLPCPKCGSLKTRVRRTAGTIRYRECCHCKYSFKTVETA